jgi:hypothetical protein
MSTLARHRWTSYLDNLAGALALAGPGSCASKASLHRTRCATCDAEFPSRAKLFKHLRLAGHAELHAPPLQAGDAPGGARAMVLQLCAGLGEQQHATPLFRPKGTVALAQVDLEAMVGWPCSPLARLDSGDLVLTVVAARWALAPDGSPLKATLRALCLDAMRTVSPEMACSDHMNLSGGASGAVAVIGPRRRMAAGPEPRREQRGMWRALDSALADECASPLAVARAANDRVLAEVFLLGCSAAPMVKQVAKSGCGRLGEACVVCDDPAWLCCGPRGTMQTVAQCGHHACAPTMASWVRIQVGAVRPGTHY